MSVYGDGSSAPPTGSTDPQWGLPTDQPPPDHNYPFGIAGNLGTPVPGVPDYTGNPPTWWQNLFNTQAAQDYNKAMGYESHFSAGGSGYGSAAGSSTAAAGTVAGATIPQWLQAINTLLASRHKGSFVQVPQTPQQQALYNWASQRLMALPNNTPALEDYAASRAFSSPSFDINAAMQGKPAYTASQPLTPQQLATMMQGWGLSSPIATSTSTNNTPNNNGNNPPGQRPLFGVRFGVGGGDGAQGNMNWSDPNAPASLFNKPAI